MGWSTQSIAQTIQNVSSQATSSAAKLESFFQDPGSLITQGVAAAGNLTPEQIAAGLRGSPPQPSVVPSNVPASEIANANPLLITKAGLGGSLMLYGGLAIAAYFLFKGKK